MDSLWLVNIVAIAEPLFYLVTTIAVLTGSALLVWKTKAPGRFLILSGLAVLLAPVLLLWPLSSRVFTPTVMDVAIAKLATALAATLGALGYARLVWHIYRTRDVAAS
jgi:hypothetical protein